MNVIAFNPVPHGTFNLDQDLGMSYILTIFTGYSRLGDTICPAIENRLDRKTNPGGSSGCDLVEFLVFNVALGQIRGLTKTRKKKRGRKLG